MAFHIFRLRCGNAMGIAAADKIVVNDIAADAGWLFNRETRRFSHIH